MAIELFGRCSFSLPGTKNCIIIIIDTAIIKGINIRSKGGKAVLATKRAVISDIVFKALLPEINLGICVFIFFKLIN